MRLPLASAVALVVAIVAGFVVTISAAAPALHAADVVVRALRVAAAVVGALVAALGRASSSSRSTR